MDNAQWPQEIMVKPIEEMIIPIKSADSIERKTIRAPQKDEHSLNCPRCNSINTKFCYYNNYSLTQPRYFCKTCKRYWTEGGSLRNIPVGGGSRRNKRSSNSHSSSSSSSSSTSKCNQNHKINQPPQDLNYLAPNSTCNNTTTSQLSALELLSRGFNSFMPMSVPDPNGVVYNKSEGFPLVSEFRPTINFALDHDLTSSGYGNAEETNGRLLFPFENLKQVDHDHHHNNKDQQGEPTGYWAGMLGGGSW